ncbi:MAG: tetratricopeptide repeat protein [Phycisphaerae bacterium]|nr:tetratricopeptide repeat protein [Phycisphaerae bacterium]
MRFSTFLISIFLIFGVVLSASSAELRADDKAASIKASVVVKKTPAADTKADTKANTSKKNSTTLEDARQAFMRGRYRKAVHRYRKILSAGKDNVPAATGLAEALAMTGKYSQALQTLDAVADSGRKQTGWHMERAKILAGIGKYRQALEHAQTAGKLDPNEAEAVLVQGQLLEILGRGDEAIRAYKQMERIIEGDKFRRNAKALVALGQILNRYAVLTGRRASDQARNILHNYFQEAYQKIDRKYWPAHVAAGMFLLSKHKPAGAHKEFALAEKSNPRLPDVFAGQAGLELGRWQFEKCLALANKALKINPNHSIALYLKAACYMQWRKFKSVPPLLEKALAVNPNDVEALSLMAAAHIRMNAPDKAKPFIARVEKINPRCATLPQTIGQWLVAGRQFDQAEAYFLKAIGLGPRMAGPLASLGKMYMQTGQEAKAREVLKKAHELDDFRSDVVHYLNIAKKLENFAVKETGHFIVKVDKRRDMVLLEQVSDYMEEIYPEICGDYEYEPKTKTIIEILPSQQDFSARISGRGWIPTVGACTGRVIAITVPNKKRGRLGLHNWAQVLRHEFTHTVTLGMTGNRIPHWFTEACAVWQQKDKRAFRYIRTLVTATRENQLFPVKELNWGFIRPKRPGARMLAYAQSEWIKDFIIQTRGFEKIIEMLKGFRDGQTQEQVFKKVFNLSEKQFDEEFRRWAKETVRVWGYDPDPPLDVKKTVKLVEKSPDNAAYQADHAKALLKKSKTADAKAAAKKALDLDEDNITAMGVLARVHMRKKRYLEAVDIAKQMERIDPTTNTAPFVMAYCYLAKKNTAKAIGALELLKKRCPFNSYSYQQLTKIYLAIGQPERALPNLIYLHKHTMNDPKYARQIAEIYRTDNKKQLALAFFREVTYINPYEASAYRGMAELYARTRQYGKALLAARNLTLLEGDSDESWYYLAKVGYRAGKAAKSVDQLKKAKQAAEKALKINPKSKAKFLMQYIDAAIESLHDKKP